VSESGWLVSVNQMSIKQQGASHNPTNKRWPMNTHQVNNHQWTIDNQQSTINNQPSPFTINHQPSTINHQPSPINVCTDPHTSHSTTNQEWTM